MRAVIQRVKKASVQVSGQTVGAIQAGILIFLGIAKNDQEKDADFLANKIIELRIFDDAKGKMNLSALDVQASLLVVSQFTLLANCQQGRRPSFDMAAQPMYAQQLYEYFVAALKKSNLNIATGQFRAMMDVSLVNDGPVTLVLESSS